MNGFWSSEIIANPFWHWFEDYKSKKEGFTLINEVTDTTDDTRPADPYITVEAVEIEPRA